LTATNNDGKYVDLATAAKAYVASLNNFKSDVKTESDAILVKLNSIKANQATMITDLKTHINGVSGFKTDIQTFMDKVTGSNGVLEKLNCYFLKQNLQRV